MGIYMDKFIVFADGRVGIIKMVHKTKPTLAAHVRGEIEYRTINTDQIRYDAGIYVEKTIGQSEGFNGSIQDTGSKKESDQGGN